MLLTIGAQVIDAVLIKTSLYFIEGSTNVLWWASKSLYNWYNSPQKVLTEAELLKEEISTLKNELNIIKHEIHPDDNNDNNGYDKILMDEL